MRLPDSRSAKFLSTPSARRATGFPRPQQQCRSISIHALREEGDAYVLKDVDLEDVISIHALREEGDMQQLFAMQMQQQFLSTPSARRATCQNGKV